MARNLTPPTPYESPEHPATVLIVDGNEEHQALGVTVLGRRGFQVSVADSAKEALRLLASKNFDAIVLAHKLRDSAGLDALRLLSERAPDIPKIFVVPEGAEEVAVRALHSGATGYLVKTPRYHELLPAQVEDQLEKVRFWTRLRDQGRVLAETQARYREFIETAQAPVFVLDLSGAFVTFNDALCSLLRYPREELVRTNLLEVLVPPPGTEPIQGLAQLVNAGAERDLRLVLRRKDGSELVLEAVPHLIRKEGEVVGVEVVAKDVTDRNRAERELKDLYGWLQAIHEATNDAVLLESLAAKPVQWNEGALALLDVDEEAFATSTTDALVQGLAKRTKEPAGLLAAAERVRREPEAVVEGTLELAGPDSRAYAHLSTPVRNPEGVLIGRLWTFRDVTERQRAEEALGRVREQLGIVVANAPVVLLAADSAGTITLAEGKGLETLGLRPSDLVGRPIGEFYGPGGVAFPEVAAKLRDGESVAHEVEVRGHVFESRVTPFRDPRGRVVGAIGVFTDVTDRRRAEEQLRYQANLVQNVFDAIISSDADFGIRSWNKAAEAIYGWRADEVIGRPASILKTDYLGADREEIFRYVTEKGGWTGELEQSRKDGSRVRVLASGTTLRDRQGRVTGYVSVNRDITEIQRARESVRRSNDILAAVRFAADEFLKAPRWQDAIQEVLSRLGTAAGVSRVRIFEVTTTRGESYTRPIHEWTAPGIPSQIDRLGPDNVAYSQNGMERWAGLFRSGDIVSGHVRELPASEQAYLVPQGVRSVAVVPIFVRGRWWGTMGMDQCDREREWSTPELEALKAAVGTLAAAIERSEAEDERRAVSERMRALVDASPEAITALNAGGLVTIWNPAAEKMFGWKEEEVLGKPLPTLPADRREAHRQLREQAMRGEAISDVRDRRLRKDGTVIDVRISVAPFFDREGKVIGTLGLIADVTEATRAERVQAATYRISEAANSVENLGELFRSVHKIISELMPARNFYIALCDEAKAVLTFPYFVDEREPPPGPQPFGRGLTEYVIRSGKPLLASPETFDALVRDGKVALVGPPSVDWLGVPLIVNGRTIGVLVVQGYEEGVRYTERDLGILTFVSEQVAMAIDRRRAEDAIREREERFRRLTDNALDLIFRYRLHPTPGFEFVSPAATTIMGYTPEEHYADPELGKKIVHPEDRVFLEEAMVSPEAIRKPLTLRWVRKDGSIVWTEQRNVPIFDSEGRFVAIEGVARDVTDRHKAEAALRASEERYRLLFESNPEPMWVYDAETLRFLAVNDAAIRHYGYHREEFLEMTIKDIRPPEDVHALEKTLQDLGHGIHFSGYWRHRKKDGAVIDVNIVSHPISFGGRPARLVLADDVTEEKKAQDDLRRSEQRFRTLFEAAADGILLIDRLANILDINPAGEQIIGQPRSSLVGVNLKEFLLPADLEGARDYLRSVLRGSPIAEPYEPQVRMPDGRLRSLEVRSRAVHEPGTEPYVEMVIRDVTEKNEMQRRLLDSERLASVGKLSAHVAHEINTPLTNISLLTASIARKSADQEILDKLEKINVQRRMAANIITDLLKFARPKELNRQEVDLRQIVLGAVEQVEAFRKPGVLLRKDLGERPVRARVDALQLHEVCVNLLKNALEATERGHVGVRIEQRAEAVEVVVEDTGTGMPPEVIARLFEPFFTTKKFGEGTGLGLPLCQSIVMAHGGKIEVASEAGKGSAFRVLLPRGEAP